MGFSITMDIVVSLDLKKKKSSRGLCPVAECEMPYLLHKGHCRKSAFKTGPSQAQCWATVASGRDSTTSVQRMQVSGEGGAPRSELQVAYEDQHRHGVGEDGARRRGWAGCRVLHHHARA